MPTNLFSFIMPSASFVSTRPTPAIMAFSTVSPAKFTMVVSSPHAPSAAIVTPAKNTIERRSRMFLPIVPASTIVSAWKEIGATEPSSRQPITPTPNPSAVGTEAKPMESASSPCGMPLSTTPIAARISCKNSISTHLFSLFGLSRTGTAIFIITARVRACKHLAKKRSFCHAKNCAGALFSALGARPRPPHPPAR